MFSHSVYDPVVTIGWKQLRLKVLSLEHKNLHEQTGSAPDHSPVSKHLLISSPSRLKPSSQLYVANEPMVVPVSSTSPPSGGFKDGQSDAVCMTLCAFITT